jgi:hypothetical protein
MHTCVWVFAPKGLHIIAHDLYALRGAPWGCDVNKNLFLPCRGFIANPLLFKRAVISS